VQVDEHPSPEVVSPSSQPSLPTCLLSPQTVVQVSAADALPPVQEYPVSTVQVEEQPSPEVVSASSHASVPVLKPSPQTAADP